MKTIIIFIALSILSLSLSAQDLDAQMQEIRNAAPSERVKLMNALKKRIAKMNQNERSAAINELKIKMNAKNKNHLQVNRGQFQNAQDGFRKQGNNLRQAGKQYLETPNISNTSLDGTPSSGTPPMQFQK